MSMVDTDMVLNAIGDVKDECINIGGGFFDRRTPSA